MSITGKHAGLEPDINLWKNHGTSCWQVVDWRDETVDSYVIPGISCAKNHEKDGK